MNRRATGLSTHPNRLDVDRVVKSGAFATAGPGRGPVVVVVVVGDGGGDGGYVRPNPKRCWATLRIWISSAPSVIR